MHLVRGTHSLPVFFSQRRIVWISFGRAGEPRILLIGHFIGKSRGSLSGFGSKKADLRKLLFGKGREIIGRSGGTLSASLCVG